MLHYFISATNHFICWRQMSKLSTCNTSLIVAPNNIIEQSKWILITNVSDVVCL